MDIAATLFQSLFCFAKFLNVAAVRNAEVTLAQVLNRSVWNCAILCNVISFIIKLFLFLSNEGSRQMNQEITNRFLHIDEFTTPYAFRSVMRPPPVERTVGTGSVAGH